MRPVFSRDPLRIALIAPPWYPLPPHGYGGTELVVHLLQSQLRRMGHRVTVFGAEGSESGVVALAPSTWSKDLGGGMEDLRLAAYLARVFSRLEGERFDVIHDHAGPAGLLLSLQSGVAPVVVHTVHGRLREPDLTFYADVDHRAQLVAISSAQAASARGLRLAAVIHNAVDLAGLRPTGSKDDYLVEIARICPEKGQHLAIEVARRTGRPLILAGKIEPGLAGERYFQEMIAPHLGRHVEYHPNVAGEEKTQLIARAAAGIFPLQWSEPFGLALAECMASGTPVLALRCGSAPELINPGVTGFVADDIDGLAAAVELLDEIDPVQCAALGRQRFSPLRMAEGYLAVYHQALADVLAPAEALAPVEALAAAEALAPPEVWPSAATETAGTHGSYRTLLGSGTSEHVPAS